MRNKLKTIAVGCLIFLSATSLCQKIVPTYDSTTGGISDITISNDSTRMNWIIKADCSQYPWIGKDYQWGLGRLVIQYEGKDFPTAWTKAYKYTSKQVSYQLSDKVLLIVNRKHEGNDFIEEYIFKNISDKEIKLSQIEINTPFNDNYPDASTCILRRTNAHIWIGENSTYVNAIRMGATAPHLGLFVSNGAITEYTIREREKQKGLSNTRGIISLCPEPTTIPKGEYYKITWRLFSHLGEKDFYNRIYRLGAIQGYSPRYVYEHNEKAHVSFCSSTNLSNASIWVNGKKIQSSFLNDTISATFTVNNTGHIRVECLHEKEKTHIDLWGISDIQNIILKRADFIIDKQQVTAPGNSLFGAYLPYDNETQQIYINNLANNKRSDLNEGAERVGMGIFLAKLYQQTKDDKLRISLINYAQFIRSKLQKNNYETWSNIEMKGRHRAYNYPWIAHFYFEMYQVTHESHFLLDGYQTLRAMYRHFKHSFYAIDTPVEMSISLLRANGFNAQADTLMDDFKKIADSYMRNGTNYPRSEVNYEQSIVAPSIIFLEEMYLVTNEDKYLNAVKEVMPVLEAFGGQQPSCFLHNIAIRHWDGFWFGKRQYWGDTMPHYWSTLSADAYANFARCTKDVLYAEKARNILLNNLCLFKEDGSASCAYIFPNYVNGMPAHFFDPMANDQDWALVYFLKWNNL